MSFAIFWQKDLSKREINRFARYFMVWSIGKSGSVHLSKGRMTLNVDYEYKEDLRDE